MKKSKFSSSKQAKQPSTLLAKMLKGKQPPAPVAPLPFSLADLHNRAFALHSAGQLEEAKKIYLQILTIEPNNANTLGMLGTIYIQQNQLEEALLWIDKAIAINPHDGNLYSNRGILLRRLNKYHEALESYNHAIEINNNNSDTYSNRSYIFQEWGQYENALSDCNKAIFINPNNAESHINRGNALLKLKKHQSAIESFNLALKLNPFFAEAYNGRGNILSELKQYKEAIQSYDKAIALNYKMDELQSRRLHVKAKICSWSNFDSELNNLIQSVQVDNIPSDCFSVLSLKDSLTLHHQIVQIYVDKKYPFNHELGLIPQRSASGQSSKIRIGYFSSDFHGKHPVANVIAELFELHDKSRFEIIAFSFGVDTQDALRQRIVNAFDQFIDVRTYTDKEVAQLARTMEIDIAVDLNGFTADNRFGIFSYRAAPIQVCYLGYPGTVGAEYMDYLIADPTIIPEESRIYYSGKIAYLPHCYQVNDRKRVISDRIFTRAELGLPDSGFVFCCFNNNYKIIPSVFDSWMKILHQVPNSVLWLVRDNDTAADNLLKEAQQRGIDATRIIFAQRVPLTEDYLARNRMADLFLDTLPYNAHSTASDALWAGLPVLTRMGESFASRVAGSLLNAIGLPELITTTAEEFEAKAVDLALNPEKLQAIREKLHRNRLTTPLFDSELFTRHLENAYTQMMQRYHCGLSPDHLVIPALNP